MLCFRLPLWEPPTLPSSIRIRSGHPYGPLEQSSYHHTSVLRLAGGMGASVDCPLNSTGEIGSSPFRRRVTSE